MWSSTGGWRHRNSDVPCLSNGIAQPNNHDLGLEVGLPQDDHFLDDADDAPKRSRKG